MHVLLTGGSGFIGRRVLALLTERGYQVRVLSRDRSRVMPPTCCFPGDITDPSACREATSGVEVVIHAAGNKREAGRFWAVNVLGTRNVLEAALQNGVTKFVHISSVGVIGADPFQARVFDEESRCDPRNEYERSKWEAERQVRQGEANGLVIAILRPGNVFGDRDPGRGLLALARNLRRGRFAFLGGRDATCNYVFVDDVAYAVLALLENPKAAGRTYHLSDGCTLGDLVDTLADELGVRRPGCELPSWAGRLIRDCLRRMSRLGWASNTPWFARLVSLNSRVSFATSRLADELGFEYPVGWRRGVRRMVQWYQSQGAL